jgi:hypothetical protein
VTKGAPTIMANRNLPSFGELLSLLNRLGFEAAPGRRDRVYRHAVSDIWMVFAARDNDDLAREADVVAVRKQLIERGLMSEEQFDRFLTNAASAVGEQ